MTITDQLKRDLAQLPEMGDPSLMLTALSSAEARLISAQAEMDRAVEDLAHSITADWSYMEILQSPLRAHADLMRHVREITGEV